MERRGKKTGNGYEGTILKYLHFRKEEKDKKEEKKKSLDSPQSGKKLGFMSSLFRKIK